jgi:hypothetical protein
MRTTRILLADKSGVLCEAALRLHWMLPDLTRGACAVRSADTCEPLTQWHPDLVLMDPNLDESGGVKPIQQSTAPLDASRVLVVSLSYEPERATRAAPGRPARSQRIQRSHLASATVQSVEMKNPVLARYAARPDSEMPPAQGESRVAHEP